MAVSYYYDIFTSTSANTNYWLIVHKRKMYNKKTGEFIEYDVYPDRTVHVDVEAFEALLNKLGFEND